VQRIGGISDVLYTSIYKCAMRFPPHLSSNRRSSIRICPYHRTIVPSFDGVSFGGGDTMYGAFGGYTRWAVVFLIIFVLFFLFVPAYGPTCGVGVGMPAAPGVAMSAYDHHYSMYGGGYNLMGGMMGYESPSSP
jgi:hypothetical protein